TELINAIAGVNRVIAPVETNAPVAEMEVRACAITEERLKRLRKSDGIVRRLSHESGYDHQIWQFPVILIPLGTEGAPDSIVLRPIDSVDGMTAQSVMMPADLLDWVCVEVMRVEGIAGVFYDRMLKPPGTV